MKNPLAHLGLILILWHTGSMIRADKLTPEEVAGLIDHTFLKTEKEGVSLADQKKEVEKLCKEAHSHGAFSVCVRENMVSEAKRVLDSLGSSVKIVSVIGFPIGDDYSTAEKMALLKKARADGADEFDMVFNYKAFQRGETDKVYEDIVAVSRAAGTDVLKLIFENCNLKPTEKRTAYQLARNAFVASFNGDVDKLKYRFFKTSTGFAKAPAGVPIGATLDDVKLMQTVGEGLVGIKPAGGVSNLEDAQAYFEAVDSPMKNGKPDPMKFRIGSSGLLGKLFGESSKGGY